MSADRGVPSRAVTAVQSYANHPVRGKPLKPDALDSFNEGEPKKTKNGATSNGYIDICANVGLRGMERERENGVSSSSRKKIVREQVVGPLNILRASVNSLIMPGISFLTFSRNSVRIGTRSGLSQMNIDGNFTSLVRLHNLPVTPDAKIKLVSIPQVILSIAMRDLSMETTDLTRLPSSIDIDSESESEAEAEMSAAGTEWEDENEVEDIDIMEIVDSDEGELVTAHNSNHKAADVREEVP
ncbi:hypothetical protein B0H14DRAFT_2655856 [Mycena olivaceomarginata]|nr:hypothetical protein B0H14DRAFT_2655856 [Mycena olivaceomarginata]